MRMHTIPQNVSAYEDKIVGALIGKQFIYLAIAGVIAVILFTTPFAPAYVRIPLAIIIVLFAVALALFRPNDRPFDELFFSYCRAIFGPTEWTWGKEASIPPQLVQVLSLGEELQIPTKTSTSLKESQSQKHRQAQHYQRLMTHRQITGLDPSEIGFIEQLDFSVSVPQQLFEATKGSNNAPPMLTPTNYQQVKPTKSQTVEMKNFTVSGSATPLASTDISNFTYISADNTIATTKPYIQIQPNRSLSRQALTQATLTLPSQGEIRFDTPLQAQPNLQIIAASQANKDRQAANTPQLNPEPEGLSRSFSSPTSNLPPPTSPQNSSQPSLQSDITKSTQKTSAMNQNPTASQPNNPTNDQPQGEYEATFGTPNRQYFPVQQQPDAPNSSTPAPQDQPTATQSQPNTTPPPPSTSPSPSPSPSSEPQPLTLSDIANINTQIAYNTGKSDNDPALPENKVTETDANSIENALSELKQQAGDLDENTPAGGSTRTGLGKFDKFSANSDPALPTPDVNLTSLPINHQPQTNASDNSSYTPLPVNPVLNPESILHTIDTPPSPTSDSQPPTQPPPTSDLQPPTQQPPVDNNASQIVQAVPTLATKQLILTSEPNIINGRVIDAQDQSVPGVIIVVKNEQGEAKRALKTNKLGQFIVTTPLSNGTYTVEVDKKGFNFDIIQVQLTGMVLPAIDIHAKNE